MHSHSLQDFFEAEQDIKKALYSEPNNADLLALSKKLKVGRAACVMPLV